MFTLIAFVTLACNLALSLVPVVGVALAQLVLPLVECALLYASLAADRGDRPRIRHLIAVVSAPPRALLAVITAAFIIFAAESLVAQVVGGTNLLAPSAGGGAMSTAALVATYATGIAVSLPVMFVPFAVLFDGASFRAAFTQSVAAFGANVGALAAYGAVSFCLLLLGIATSGVGLLLALPWSAAASYAAWKDVFGVE